MRDLISKLDHARQPLCLAALWDRSGHPNAGVTEGWGTVELVVVLGAAGRNNGRSSQPD